MVGVGVGRKEENGRLFFPMRLSSRSGTVFSCLKEPLGEVVDT